MNKSDLGRRLANRTGMTGAAAANAVDGVFDVIAEALANGEEVQTVGFGSFIAGKRPARTGRNPGTGEILSIAASTEASFKASKPLRDAVNAGGWRSA